MKLQELEIKELLLLQAAVIDELKDRKVVRTKNNPVGDYTEWLVSKSLDLELAPNSKAGYDAKTKDGRRIQIKGRRITPDNKSRQLGAIRNYELKDFDDLIAVIFDKNFNVIDAVSIPHAVIEEYASYRHHVNAYVLHLKGPILTDSRIENVKSKVSS